MMINKQSENKAISRQNPYTGKRCCGVFSVLNAVITRCNKLTYVLCQLDFKTMHKITAFALCNSNSLAEH